VHVHLHVGDDGGHGVPLLVAQNVAVAAVVADMQMDVHTVCAAVLRGLLHDADEVTREVGGEAAAILAAHREVALVAACAAPRRAAPADYRALREMVLEAAAGDARAVALQLAAAAVSTRALGALPAGARERAARRAMALYAPLANRLGVYFLQSELEELAFMQLQPAAFRALSAELARLTRGSAAVLAENKAALDRALSGTPAVRGAVRSIAVRGRIKGVYSCYRKTLRTGKPLDQLHDLIALRVIVRARSADEPAQAAACFAVADAVRSHFHVIPARAKDYVTYPKPNGYRSLHLTVAHPGGTPGAWTPLEIQIRTEMMHRVAEFGSAAHWLYKHKEPWAGDTDLGLTGLATDLGELRM
jgi:GTP diphosphokinase / guanosine-3',5'-bis(diphosphate) 3'-diphosphatase